jgi:chromate transporter
MRASLENVTGAMAERVSEASASHGAGSASHSNNQKTSLSELAGFFLRLGTTAFGGPAGHIAMMEEELVRRQKWLSREKFLDLLGASNLIPGPSSSELAIHIGYLKAGWAGLVVAGCCFILPAAAMVTAIAWMYSRFGRLPASAQVLYGVKPVVIAVVAQALWGLSRAAVKSVYLGALGAVSLVFLGMQPILVLVVAGMAACVAQLEAWRAGAKGFLPFVTAAGVGAATTAASFSFGSLFLVFLKIGAIVFGSGYVLLAFLRADLVVHRGWLTDGQLVDAVAVGQVTPGPVFTTATFIGYLLGGVRGALVATIAIFLPAFLLVAASGPLVPRLRESKMAGAFLDGVNVGSLALMAHVTLQLGRSSLVDGVTVVLAVLALVALLRFRVNSAWLVLLGAVIGVAAKTIRGG